MHAFHRLPQRRQPPSGTWRGASKGSCYPRRSWRAAVDPRSRAAHGKPDDLLRWRRCWSAAIPDGYKVARACVEGPSLRAGHSRRRRGTRFCLRHGLRRRAVSGPAAGRHFHRQGRLCHASGIVAHHRRQPLAHRVAQNTAHGRNRGHGSASHWRGSASEEFCSSSNYRSGLRNRQRAHHELHPSRPEIRQTGKNQCLQ